MTLNLVDIDVSVDDADGDTLATTMLGSLTGAFAGEEFTLTAVPGDGAHTYEASHTGGTLPHNNEIFVWNAKADLGAGPFSATVHIRLTIDDSTAAVVNIDSSQTITINEVPAVVIDSVTQRVSEESTTDVLFTVSDPESDNLTYVLEGSTTGAFGGEEFALSLLVGDGAHDAVNPLTSDATGIQYTAVWDAQANLALGYSATVFFKVTVTDIAANVVSNTTNTVIDLNKPPFSQVDTVVQRAGDYALVDIGFTVADPEADNVDIVFELSLDAGFSSTFSPTAVGGDGAHTYVTPATSSIPGISYNFVWDPIPDIPVGETMVYFRLRYDDNINSEVVTQFGGNPVVIKNNAAPVVTGLVPVVEYL